MYNDPNKKKLYLGKGFVVQFLLTVGLFYCLIPFETREDGLAVAMRSLVALGLVMFVLIRHKPTLNASQALGLLVIIGVAFASVLMSYSGRFFVFILALLFGASLAAAQGRSTTFHRHLERAIFFLIVVSMIALGIQAVWWHYSGVVLPLHELAFPLSEARIDERGTFARLGGIYIEPGTYSQWIYLLFLAYMLLRRDVSAIFSALIGTAMILSVSLWGVIIGIFVIVLTAAPLARRNPLHLFLILIIASGLVFLALNSDVPDYLLRKSELESPSGMSKSQALAEYTRIFYQIAVFGNGFKFDFCTGCMVSPQDIGVFIMLSSVAGTLFTASLFAIVFIAVHKKYGLWSTFLFAPLLVSKVFYWDFIFWMIVFLALYSKTSTNTGSPIMAKETLI